MSGKYGEDDDDAMPHRPRSRPSRPSSDGHTTGLSGDDILKLVENEEQESKLSKSDREDIKMKQKGRRATATLPGAVAMKAGQESAILQESPPGLSNLDQSINEKLNALGTTQFNPASTPGAVHVSGNDLTSGKAALKKSAGPALINITDEEAPLSSPVVAISKKSYDDRISAKINQEITRLTQEEIHENVKSSTENVSNEKDRFSGTTAFVEVIPSHLQNGTIDRSSGTDGKHPNGSFGEHGVDNIEPRTANTWIICLCVLIFLVGVPIAISLGVVLSRDNESETVPETSSPLTSGPSVAPSTSPTIFYTLPPTEDLGLSLTAPITSTFSWTPLAQSITGIGGNDRFGTSLSFSYNGTVLAVGAPANIDGGGGAGQVQVFQLTDDNNEWLPLGQKLNGAATDRAGNFVFLAGDAKVLAISSTSFSGSNLERNGKVTCYTYNDKKMLWEQIGEPIEGSGDFDAFGESVALNAVSPRRVIIGSSRNNDNCENCGHAKVFEYDETLNDWVQIGTTFFGKSPNDRLGSSVSMSASGSRISLSAPLSDEGGPEAGSALIFDFDSDSQTWTSAGTGIYSNFAYSRFGASLQLSGSGRYLIVGSPRGELADDIGSTKDEGTVSVYESIGSNWILRGQVLGGEKTNDRAGQMVGISYDGSKIAFSVGVAGFGVVQIYEYDSESKVWLPQGNQIFGAGVPGENFGSSLSLSASGYRVAVGADGYQGSVSVYEY